ncbi:MAG: hypothetical protein ACRC7S_02500 [Cetobacterium sp.]
MIETNVAQEIVAKAIALAGDTPDVGMLDIYTGSRDADEFTVYFYNRIAKLYTSERLIINSKYEGDIDELIELMKGYNERVQKSTDELLEGEYSWVDVDTFRYCYRVGTDYGYCHITKCGSR